MGLPVDQQTWELMPNWGKNVPQCYWSNVSICNISPHEESTKYAVQHLFDAGRPYAALNLAGFSIRSRKSRKDMSVLPKELIVRLLEEVPKYDPKKEEDVALNSLSHDIPEFLDILEAKEVDVLKLVQLEWIWMTALEYTPRGFKALQKALSETPAFFIDLLKIVYRGENEKPQESSEEEKKRATQASRLLERWKIVPGMLYEGGTEKKEKRDGDIIFPQGTINQKVLFAWISEARKIAQDCGCLDICDFQIGRVLAYSPSDSKGHWPCEAVCNLIEELASDELERGVNIGVYNKRGCYCRAKGGEQERKLVSKFRCYSKQVCSKWTRTATMLNCIAGHYEWEARRNDERDAIEEFK